MNLDELSAEWRQKRVPVALDNRVMEKIGAFESKLKKENLKLTYWFAGTLYLTGFVVFPLLEDSGTMLLLGGIWMLIGFQAIVFWMRQIHLGKSMIDNPEQFIKAKLSRLRYNLLVTNLFMPLYLILLGVLSSFYLNGVLRGVDKTIIAVVIVLTCLFYISIFYVVWKKQRRRDLESVVPQIKELETIEASYNNV